jgi:exopolysaccharide biosynthesis WecB/TagA/CpsF family protein
VDSVPAVCEIAVEEGYSVFFMGGEEGIAQETADLLAQRYPELKIAGVYSPPYLFEQDPEEEAKAIEIVRRAKPNFLFLAINSPRAEKWLYKRKQELNVPVMMAIGGAFNFITGREKRAPEWIQNLGLEGLYRLCRRPKDIWQRLIINVPYFFLLFLDLLSYRFQKRITYWGRPLALGFFDGCLASISFVFSYWLYFRSGLFSTTADPFPEVQSVLAMPAYSELLFIVAILGVFSMWMNRLYRRDKYITYLEILGRCVKASLLSVILLICFQFIFLKNLLEEYQFLGYSRMVFGLFGLFLFLAWASWRLKFHYLEHVLHRLGFNIDRIIIVGTNESAHAVDQELNKHPELGITVLGFITTPNEGKEASSLLGTIKDLRRLLPARKVDEVLVADSSISQHDWLEIVHLCQKHHVMLSVIPSIHELLGISSEIKRIGDFRVITISANRSSC